jgi:GTP cyclohydrolase IV
MDPRHSSCARTSLSRVGLTGVEKVIHVGVDGRSPQLFSARLECFVELGPAPRGAHVPRFEEAINDAVSELVLDDAGMRTERLAQQIAETVRERQDARRAAVTIAARFPERRPESASGAPTHRISTLYGRAVASERGTRRMVGVSAKGMTTSPYAEGGLVARARERLAAGGFSEAQIARIVDDVPVATHSQLGIGTLHLGCPEGCALEFDAAVLLAIVGRAMSSKIVEECVRAMIAGVVERFAGVPDEVFVAAAQENLGTIHGRNVIAERAGRLGDLRRELATGQAGARYTSMREWLEATG